MLLLTSLTSVAMAAPDGVHGGPGKSLANNQTAMAVDRFMDNARLIFVSGTARG